jgi:hypothetical protein
VQTRCVLFTIAILNVCGGNNEYCNHIENFEDVWSTRIVWLDHIEEEDMSSVAHLGYD